MPSRRRTAAGRRTPSETRAEARARDVATSLGRALKDARLTSRQTQRQASDSARVAQSTWSEAERGEGADFTVATWTRMAGAVGSEFTGYLSRASAAGRPRDEVHLRHQELIIRTAERGGWKAAFEAALGDPLRGARSVDVLLTRAHEIAITEIFDWFDDVGAATRSWDRKLASVEARAIGRHQTDEQASAIRIGGCWIVRATGRNRELVAGHDAIFRARFPAPGIAWLRALQEPTAPMPDQPGLLWISVSGERLWPARLGIRPMPAGPAPIRPMPAGPAPIRPMPAGPAPIRPMPSGPASIRGTHR